MAATLVDLARHTTHALAQHFRSYLSRHAAPPAPALLRPRVVMYARGVATGTGGARGRTGGQQGGAVESRGQDKGKPEVKEEPGREARQSVSTSTIASTCSKTSSYSTSSLTSSYSTSSNTSTSSRNSALLRQFKKGKRWLSRTAQKLATDPQKDNRRVKAAALNPRSGYPMNPRSNNHFNQRSRSNNRFINVGLNSITSQGAERKNILGFDASRMTQGGQRARAGVTGGGVTHVFLSKYNDSNITRGRETRGVASRDQYESDVAADLIKRLYGVEEIEEVGKTGEVWRTGEIEKTGRKKRKRYATENVESSGDGSGSGSLEQINSKKPKVKTGEEVMAGEWWGVTSQRRSDTLDSMTSQRKSDTHDSVQNTAGLRSSRTQRPGSESECNPRPRYEDTRQTNSHDSINNRSRAPSHATKSFILVDQGVYGPMAPVTKPEVTVNKPEMTWREMKQQPEVWANDIRKRLELYATQHVAGKFTSDVTDKPTARSCTSDVSAQSHDVITQSHDVIASPPSIRDLGYCVVTECVNHAKSEKTKNKVKVTELKPEVIHPNAQQAAKDRPALSVFPDSKPVKGPQLCVTVDDMALRDKPIKMPRFPGQSDCKIECSSRCKPKSRLFENNDEKTTRTISKVSIQDVCQASVVHPEPWLNVLVDPKTKVNKMDVNGKREFPNSANNIAQLVDDVLKTSKSKPIIAGDSKSKPIIASDSKSKPITYSDSKSTNVSGDTKVTLYEPSTECNDVTSKCRDVTSQLGRDVTECRDVTPLGVASPLTQGASPKLLTRRDHQLIEEIKQQWADKFKDKWDRMLKRGQRSLSERSPGVSITPLSSGSENDVYSTPMNSVKPSPAPQRRVNDDKVFEVKDDNMFEVKDSMFEVNVFDNPEVNIKPLTRSDLTYWEWVNDLDTTTKVTPRDAGKVTEVNQNTNKILQDIRETFLRSDFKKSTRPQHCDTSHVKQQRNAMEGKTTTCDPNAKGDHLPNAKGDYVPYVKLGKEERKKVDHIIRYLNGIQTARGGKSLEGLMEMKLVPVQPDGDAQPAKPMPRDYSTVRESDVTETGIMTSRREAGIWCSPRSGQRSGVKPCSNDLISGIQDLLKDGDALAATLRRKREDLQGGRRELVDPTCRGDNVKDVRRELIESYRRNIRRHQRVLDRYRGKLWKLRLMDVEHRAAKNKSLEF